MLEGVKYEDNFITGIIDATESENEFREYIAEQATRLPEGEIEIDRMAMVRATGVLPENGKITPSCKSRGFTTKPVSGYKSVAGRILLESNEQLWNKSLYDEEAYIKFKEIEDTYIPYSSQYRSTIHFTINALVGNHLNGNFDNYPYIIVEPLNKHINDEKIVTIRPEDTFFQQEIELSEESAILMQEEEYSKISYEKREKLAERMKIFIYNGNKEIALQKLLLNLGYFPEKVNGHGLINSETSSKLEKGIIRIRKWKGKGGKKYDEPHNCTNVYKEDDYKSLIIWEKYDRTFLKYLIKEFNLNEDIIEDLLDYDAIRIMEQLIRRHGLDKYKKVVQTFNKAIEMKTDKGIMPTNEEISSGVEILTEQELSIAEEIMNKNIQK